MLVVLCVPAAEAVGVAMDDVSSTKPVDVAVGRGVDVLADERMLDFDLDSVDDDVELACVVLVVAAACADVLLVPCTLALELPPLPGPPALPLPAALGHNATRPVPARMSARSVLGWVVWPAHELVTSAKTSSIFEMQRFVQGALLAKSALVQPVRGVS